MSEVVAPTASGPLQDLGKECDLSTVTQLTKDQASVVQTRWLHPFPRGRKHSPVSTMNTFPALYASPSRYTITRQLHTFPPPLKAASHKALIARVIPLNSMG